MVYQLSAAAGNRVDKTNDSEQKGGRLLATKPKKERKKELYSAE